MLKKTYTNEGLRNGFYKGSSPAIYRSILISGTEMGTFDNTKDFLINYIGMRETLLVSFIAALFSGFCGSAITSPIDVVKTRYMNYTNPDPTKPRSPTEIRYTSPLDCFKKIVVNEGVGALYYGFIF